jgi:PadR family transcriptional regulator PadR
MGPDQFSATAMRAEVGRTPDTPYVPTVAGISQKLRRRPLFLIDSYLVIEYSEGMDASFLGNWTTQLRKGILELCILDAIRGRRIYGYDIVKRLRDIDALMIGEGTVYPILSRFKREGLVKTMLVDSSECPARKYYELTSKGEQHLGAMQLAWEKIKTGVHTLLKEPRP